MTSTSSSSPSFAPLSIATSTSHEDEGGGEDHQRMNGNASASASAANAVMITDPQTGQPRVGYWKTTYRGGFSTSLCEGLFANPYDRSSCCALTCCGTFLQDRNTYLLTGERPPPWWFRILLYVGGFLASIVVGALLSAVSSAPGMVVWTPLFFVVGMAMRATALRQQTRYQLQEKMAQTRNNNEEYISIRSEHWCCACVSNDKRRVLVDEPPMDDMMEEQQRRQKADFCFRLWQCLAWTCCDACCFSWWHWCGLCATGQEDRELKRMFPRQVFLRDYITFQPYGDYYPQIQWLREEESSNDNFWNHLGALSELSRKLLSLLQWSLLVLLLAASLHLFHSFNLAKVIVIVATLLQAFLILYVVYWRNHRHDISLDAIIKLFASGFVLAMTVALVVELILDTMGSIVFDIVFQEEYIEDHPEMAMDNDNGNNYNNGGGYNNYNDNDNNNNNDFSTPFDTYDTFKDMAKKHFPTLMVYLFFKAVVVAALVEELTKYFCFWMVEHPDFIYGGPETDTNVNTSQQEGGEEAVFVNGGGTTTGATPTACTSASMQPPTYDPNPNPNSNPNHTPPLSPSQAATTNLPPFRPRTTPLHSNAAAAITVGMVATAVGFSCAENLMYVFTQGSIAGEISVLLARSALPVHSICAAMQSIGIVRRDVELQGKTDMGWAILPAVVFHGLFDYALLVIAMIQVVTLPDPPLDESGQPIPQDVRLQDQLLPMAVGLVITAIGVFYYVVEAKKQRGRLSALEMTNNDIPSTVGVFV